MKKILYLLAFLVFHQGITHAQSVPISGPVSDQLVLGPCYIFATVAALESKAIQSGYNGVDFFEWNLYSKSVMGSFGSNDNLMVSKSIENATNFGIYNKPSVGNPTSIFQLPNPNITYVPGIADFSGDGCVNDLTTSYYNKIPESACRDHDDSGFEISPLFGYNYFYEFEDALGYQVVEPSDGVLDMNEMINHLNNGEGLIALFDRWGENQNGHAVFLYAYNDNGLWSYKDSWKGNPGNKTASWEKFLALGIYKYYYLTGTITSDAPAGTPVCQAVISGNQTVTGNTTYTLSDGNHMNLNWSTSENLNIISQNSNTIIVSPNTCENSTGAITINYQEGADFCSTSLSVNIIGASQTPDNILVLSPYWSNVGKKGGKTCPNTTLELLVIDTNNPNYPETTYDWAIYGATLLSGDGTPTVFVQTPNTEWETPLTFQVRAKNGDCPYSDWIAINGTSSPENCRGEDGGPKSITGFVQNQILVIEGFKPQSQVNNSMNYQIISIDGKLLQQGIFDTNYPVINIANVNQKLLILHVFDAQNFHKSIKLLNP